MLSKTANTDALTNIPNRLFLTNKLNELSQNSNRYTDRYALLFCDLDGFKSVNDKYGHAVGDRILSQVAKRLRNEIREEDIIARYGGDEFVILITDRASLVTLNAVRKKIFNSISAPFQLSGDEIKIGISIGAAIYPDDGTEPDELLIKADQEMYSSKNS
ncbi:GGDEF domain-containing protein [Psychrosphaera sp.]|nr:GGDEF domain-containing protein [Psychrosphaera sp.]